MREARLAVYVHWPFCLAKCPYCDFNSHVRAAVDQPRWAAALAAEIDHVADETPGRTVASVFFGGGTPSLMEPSTISAVLDRIAARWWLADEAEITLEANPTSVEAARFRGYAAAGVNRVSLGVQALNDADLRALGRKHDSAEAVAALGVARRHFRRYSFDLIYARPGQTVEGWRAELARALDLAGDHLSVYQLTIEPGTAFHAAHRRGELVTPDEDTQAALYEATGDVLAAAGLPAYEISNHARPGGESRHNLAYWRYEDYAGIGPGAHGRLTLDGDRWATRTHRGPEIWLARVEAAGHGEHPRERIAPDSAAAERLMMGLRLVEGVALDAETEAAIDGPALDRLVAGGFLVRSVGRIAATAEGLQRLDAVLPALLRS